MSSGVFYPRIRVMICGLRSHDDDGLHDLREIDDDELTDGTEVYSQMGRKHPEAYVVSKERLSCFWSNANRDKTAAEILDE